MRKIKEDESNSEKKHENIEKPDSQMFDFDQIF